MKRNYLPYKIYNNQYLTSSRKKDNISDYVICAIDPALKNCAIRIEGKDKKTVFQDKFSFVPVILGKRGGVKKVKTTQEEKNNTFMGVMDTFMGIKDELMKCDFILIESQHHKNKDMLKTSSAIIMCLLMMTSSEKNPPIIIEIDPKVKSSVYFMKEDGATNKMKKPELKKWAAAKGLEILKRNGDDELYKKISKETKKDDHGDVICYTECFRKSFLSDEMWVKKLFN